MLTSAVTRDDAVKEAQKIADKIDRHVVVKSYHTQHCLRIAGVLISPSYEIMLSEYYFSGEEEEKSHSLFEGKVECVVGPERF